MTHFNKREVHAKAFELNEKRKTANAAILTKLHDYLLANPGLRFSQALFNLDIVIQHYCMSKDNSLVWRDDFYLESNELLKRLK